MLEGLNFAMDIALILTSLWAVFMVKDLGQLVGAGFWILALGFVILGLAHLSETVLFQLSPNLETAMQELIHRLLVFSGFVFLIIGLRKLLVK